VPTTEQDAQWVRLSVSADVRSPAGCSVVLRTRGTAGVWLDVDDVSVAPGRVQRSVRGVDLSSLAKNQDHGAVYRDVRGHRVDPVRLLAASGANVGRLKVWVDPADGYNDTAHVVATARRITAAGMRLLVDFHYSDRWADPGAQAPPAAWAGFTAPQMADAVAKHTTSVLTALKRAGISADYVQVGNEINPGLLLPLGQTYDVNPDDAVAGAQWANVAAFLTAGARAVKAVDPRAQVLLHLTNINNGVDGLTWWFDNVTARNVPFDAIGLSYYSYWHGSLGDLQNAVSTLSARYDKDVIVLETSYPWTLADDPVSPYANVIDQPGQLAAGYPATPQGQAANFAAVQDAVVSAPGGRGLDVGRRRGLGPFGPQQRRRLGQPGDVRPLRPCAARRARARPGPGDAAPLTVGRVRRGSGVPVVLGAGGLVAPLTGAGPVVHAAVPAAGVVVRQGGGRGGGGGSGGRRSGGRRGPRRARCRSLRRLRGGVAGRPAGFAHGPLCIQLSHAARVVARADRYFPSPATRLIVAATITTPNR
jgi:arabinogalactan endo-1,4-beta-galactosidase